MHNKEKTNENEILKAEISQRKQAEEKIDLLAHALRSISECVSITDMEDIILFVNDAFLKTYGYEEDELLNKPIDVIRSPNNPIEVVKEILPATLRGGWQGEILNRRKDGTDFPIALSTSVIRNEEGQPIALIGVANDISERKQAAEEALRQQNEYLAALHDTTLGLITRLDLNNLLEALVIRAGQLLDTPHGYIYLIDPFTLSKDEVDNVELERKVGVGVFNQSIRPRLKLGEGLAGKVWQSGKPLVVNNYETWSGRSPNVSYDIVVRALMGLPLTQSRGKGETRPQVVGVLGIAYGTETDRDFGDEEVELLSRFAQLASIALDNARLFETEQHQRQVAESLSQVAAVLNANLELDTLLEQIMVQLRKVIEYDSAGILLNDGDSLLISGGTGSFDFDSVGHRIPLTGSEPTSLVFMNQRSLVIADVQKDPNWVPVPGAERIRGWMGIPLVTGDKSIGVLTIDSFSVGTYNAKHAEIVRAFANQAAIAIENAQLLKAEQKQRELAETLRQATVGLTSALELQQVLDNILVELEQVVSYDSATIQQLKGNRLEIISGIGFPNLEELLGVSFELKTDNNPNGEVMRTRAPLIVDDALATYSEFRRDVHKKLVRSWLGVPLLFGDRLIGMIAIDNEKPGLYTEADAHLAMAFAAQAAIAIENARLFEETQEAKEMAEATNKELSQTLEELRTTQGQLVESEKMAALGGLVAGVAHEINTPVGVSVTAASTLQDKTSGFSEIYKSGQMKRSDLEKYLSIAEQSSAMILRNLERAANLIQSFKQVAVDQSSEERRSFLVKAYLEEILLSLRPKLKNTQLSIEINGDDSLTLDSYPGAFSQIVTNLVMNSLLHAYGPDDQGQLTFDLGQGDGRLVFEYNDDGKGIPAENLGKIFEPFFTTKRTQGGSGLGLHIIYNLVTQRMGGSIRCESEVGSGTKFVIEVPLS